MAKLNTYVHVHDPDNPDRSGIFGPGDDLPDWAVTAITNPDVWAEAPEIEAAHQGETDTGGAGSDDGDGAPDEDPGPPPRSGPGSGKDRWAAYARSHDVEVTDDMTRDAIIAALTEAGVPTE